MLRKGTEEIQGYEIDWGSGSVTGPGDVEVEKVGTRDLVLLRMFLMLGGSIASRDVISAELITQGFKCDPVSVSSVVTTFKSRTLRQLGLNNRLESKGAGGYCLVLHEAASHNAPAAIDEEEDYDPSGEPLDEEGWNYHRELMAEGLARRGRTALAIGLCIGLPEGAVQQKLDELEAWGREKDRLTEA